MAPGRGPTFKFVKCEGFDGQSNEYDEARGEILQQVLSRLSLGLVGVISALSPHWEISGLEARSGVDVVDCVEVFNRKGQIESSGLWG